METKFFGENACYIEGDEEGKSKAKMYLELWKEFLIERLRKDSFSVVLHDEQWGEIPAYLSGCMNPRCWMYLKVCLKSEFRYELGKRIE